MQRTKPPFRADQVGSFLRSDALKQARAKRAKGEITPAQLKAVEDQEIKNVIKKQEDVGMKLATDGEFRRTFWHFDFLGGMQGVDLYDHVHGVIFEGAQTKKWNIRVNGKVDFPDDHPFLDHFRFLAANTKVVPKMTIPSPTVMHFRVGPEFDQQRSLSRSRPVLPRCRQGLWQGGEGLLRRRLPLSAIRRHGVGLSLLGEGTGEVARARRPARRPAAEISPT